MVQVTMFTPPDDCSACRATKVGFNKVGVEYTVVEVDDEAADQLRREGHSAFPVVKVDCGDDASWSWSGYRFDDIKRLAQLIG
jgi:glutaredoxin